MVLCMEIRGHLVGVVLSLHPVGARDRALRPSGLAASTFTCRAISPAQALYISASGSWAFILGLLPVPITPGLINK